MRGQGAVNVSCFSDVHWISNQERLNYCQVKYTCSGHLSKDWTWCTFDTVPNLPWDLYLLAAVSLALIIEVWIIIRVSGWRAMLLARFIAHQMAGGYQLDSSVCLHWRVNLRFLSMTLHRGERSQWQLLYDLCHPTIFCKTTGNAVSFLRDPSYLQSVLRC